MLFQVPREEEVGEGQVCEQVADCGKGLGVRSPAEHPVSELEGQREQQREDKCRVVRQHDPPEATPQIGPCPESAVSAFVHRERQMQGKPGEHHEEVRPGIRPDDVGDKRIRGLPASTHEWNPNTSRKASARRPSTDAIRLFCIVSKARGCPAVSPGMDEH